MVTTLGIDITIAGSNFSKDFTLSNPGTNQFELASALEIEVENLKRIFLGGYSFL